MTARTLHRVLAAVALGSSAIAAAWGETSPASRWSIAPLELAERIHAREAGLVVLDARGEKARLGLAVPRARTVDPGTPSQWAIDSARFVVVYGEDAATSVALWNRSRDAWPDRIFWLEGGLDGWVRDVLEPMLPAPETRADSARVRAITDLSLYFGGSPGTARPGDALRDHADAATLVKRARRRGCGPES